MHGSFFFFPTNADSQEADGNSGNSPIEEMEEENKQEVPPEEEEVEEEEDIVVVGDKHSAPLHEEEVDQVCGYWRLALSLFYSAFYLTTDLLTFLSTTKTQIVNEVIFLCINLFTFFLHVHFKSSSLCNVMHILFLH